MKLPEGSVLFGSEIYEIAGVVLDRKSMKLLEILAVLA